MANKKEIKIPFNGKAEDYDKVAKSLKLLAKNIYPENLETLGEKSSGITINMKIKNFKHLL